MQNVGVKPTIAISTRTYSKIVVATIFNKHKYKNKEKRLKLKIATRTPILIDYRAPMFGHLGVKDVKLLVM
jgi:hypothetical protein